MRSWPLAMVAVGALLAPDARSQPSGPTPLSLELGDLLVSDGVNGRILRVRPGEGAVDVFASGEDFPLVVSPGDLVQAPDGIVYVADRVEGYVLRIDPRAGLPSPLVTSVVGCALGQIVDFGSPWGLAVDHNGALFVASRNGSLYRVTPSTECAGLWNASIVAQSGFLFETRSLSVTSDGAGDGDFAYVAAGGPAGLVEIDLASGVSSLPSGIPTATGGEVYGVDVLGNCAEADCIAPFTQNLPGVGGSCSSAGLYQYRRAGEATILSTLFDIFLTECLFGAVATAPDEVFITTAGSLNGGNARILRMYQPGTGQPWDGIQVATFSDGPTASTPTHLALVTVAVPEPGAAVVGLAAAAALLALARRTARKRRPGTAWIPR
jgi:hypothetical protein